MLIAGEFVIQDSVSSSFDCDIYVGGGGGKLKRPGLKGSTPVSVNSQYVTSLPSVKLLSLICSASQFKIEFGDPQTSPWYFYLLPTTLSLQLHFYPSQGKLFKYSWQDQEFWLLPWVWNEVQSASWVQLNS